MSHLKLAFLLFVVAALVATRPASVANAAPPVVSILSPAGGSTVSGAVVVSAAALDDDGIHKVRFWAGSTYLGYDSSPPYERPWDTRLTVNGARTLTVQALDYLGEATTVTHVVTVSNADALPPSVSITSPAPAATVSGMAMITADATDNAAIQKVRFWAGGRYLGYDSVAPFERSWETALSVNGSVTLKAEAVDNANNATVSTISVTVANPDGTPPSVIIASPAPGAVLSGTAQIDATASDNGAVQKVRFWVDGTYLGYDSAAPYAKTFDSSLFDDGEHTLRVQAVDNAHNVAEETITVDAYNPGVRGVAPWAVTVATHAAATYGATITLTYDANNASNGQLLPLVIDGTGATDYQSSLKYGASAIICADAAHECAAASCPGAYPECAETSASCDGPECTPKTGNMVGTTRTGVDFRMENTMPECDEFAEAFAPPDVNGTYTVNPDCNPLDAPGRCATITALCSRRVVVIPIVDDFGIGSEPVTVTGFATFWLEGYLQGGCSGSQCEVTGRFVNDLFW